MNKIHFSITQRVLYGRERDLASIIIDQIDLIDMLRIHELPFAQAESHPEIAGSYMSRQAWALYRSLASPLRQDFSRNGKLDLLCCSCCGLDGPCWPMRVRIKETDCSVIWCDFEQPQRRNLDCWDYSPFGPFEFDLWEYRSEVANLKHYFKKNYPYMRELQRINRQYRQPDSKILEIGTCITETNE